MRLHYLKTIGKLVAIAAMFFTTPSTVKGQMIGWPPLGSGTTTFGVGSYEMDQVRAKVTSITTSGLNSTLGITNQVGTFAVNDYVLIIQMEGTSNGVHEMRQISNLTPFTVLSLGGTYSLTDIVQVVKVPLYDEVKLGLGTVISCSPYSGFYGTGGVLCFIANKINFDGGGYFDVSAKGIQYTLAGVGTGGNGGPGGTTTGGTPGAQPVVTRYPDISCPAFTATPGPASGGTGGWPGYNNGFLGTTTGGTLPSFGTVLSPSRITMGNCGIAGTVGGKGGGGGGKGGDGGSANSVCVSGAGLPGANGDNGEKGGDAGKGGRGAGLILIKLAASSNSIVWNGGTSPSSARFIANGENGAPGLCPNIGGFGGAGGAGATGCCFGPTNYANGNYGGYGDPGTGASGGDGGNGGKNGSIWIKFKFNRPAALAASHFSVKGGAGGPGGVGADAYSTNYLNTSTYPTCIPINPCPPATVKHHFCDCDKAFQILSGATSSSSSGSTFTFTGSSFGGPSIYNGTELVSQDGLDYYHCPLYNKSICDKIFEKITMVSSVMPTIYPIGEPIDLNITSTTLGNNSWYSLTTTTEMLNYLGTEKRLVDYSQPGSPKCYTAPCFIDNSIEAGSGYDKVPGAKGASGNTPVETPDGTVDISGANPGADASTQDLAPPPKLDVNAIYSTGLLGAKIYPVPVNNTLYLDWSVDGNALINLTDLSGKVLLSKSCDSGCANMATFNLSHLNSGVYLVNITINNSVQTLKFQKL